MNSFNPPKITYAKPILKFKRQLFAAFTLIELVAVVAIFLIFIAAIFAVSTSGRSFWQIGTTQAEIQQQARRAMDNIIRELRQASSIDQDTFVNGISEGIVRFTAQGATVEFSLNGNQLQRIVGATTSVMANDVADVQFRLFGGNTVYITLTTQRTTLSGRLLQVNLTSQVVLRN